MQGELVEVCVLLLQLCGLLFLLCIEFVQQLYWIDVLVGDEVGGVVLLLVVLLVVDVCIFVLLVDIILVVLMSCWFDVIVVQWQFDVSQVCIGVVMVEYYLWLLLGGLLGGECLYGVLFLFVVFQLQVFLGLYWWLFDFGCIDVEVVQVCGVCVEVLVWLCQQMLCVGEDVENLLVVLVQLEVQCVLLVDEVEVYCVVCDVVVDVYCGGVVGFFEVLQEDCLLLIVCDQFVWLQVQCVWVVVVVFCVLGGGWMFVV